MRHAMRRIGLAGAVLAAAVFSWTAAEAVGPRNVTSQGLPVKWASMPVALDLESDLIVRGKNVETLVDDALSQWDGVTEANVSFSLRDLGTAVDQTNVCDFLFDVVACAEGPLDDGTNPLIIDEDGEIVARFFGGAAKFTTLGFAAIIGSNPATGAAVKGEAVFNAACLEGVEIQPQCAGSGLSFSDDDFTSFIVHEMGHFLGLDHSQVNLDEATDADSANDNLITTMYPRFLVGNGANFKTPERDDRVGLAQLYPAAGFASSTWSIEGIAFNASGSSELQCANLVARNVSNPKVDAVSALSGDFDPPGTANGEFVIPGLIPGETYTVDFEPLDAMATGASGYTPCRGSNGEPSPPQFASFTSSETYSEPAGASVDLDCQAGDDCFPGGGGSSGGGSSAGGCSLVH